MPRSRPPSWSKRFSYDICSWFCNITPVFVIVQRFRVQPRHRPKKRPVKSKKKLWKSEYRIMNIECRRNVFCPLWAFVSNGLFYKKDWAKRNHPSKFCGSLFLVLLSLDHVFSVIRCSIMRCLMRGTIYHILYTLHSIPLKVTDPISFAKGGSLSVRMLRLDSAHPCRSSDADLSGYHQP